MVKDFGGFHLLPFRPPRIRRGVQLLLGLCLYGLALAIAVEARLGTNPWTVFHQGVADLTGLSFGTTVILTGLVILIALRYAHEPLGIGTIMNVAVIGPVADLALWAIPEIDALWIRLALIVSAPFVLGLASGLYLGAGVGPGPRDGLMTALSRRGLPTWRARTIVELSALLVGWLLGGDVGLGTAWMALAVGPSVHFFLRPSTIVGEMAQESGV
jgi:uncharacterized membrane protein YczE